MKIKRIAIMLTFALIVAAVPLLASVSGNTSAPGPGNSTAAAQVPQGQAAGQLQTNTATNSRPPILTFSVYGYGVLRVTRVNGSPLTYGTSLHPGTRVNFLAEEAAHTGFEFMGWAVNGVAYTGPFSMSHTLVMEDDTHVVAFFEPPGALESTHALISTINISRAPGGGVNISVPGHSNVQFEYYVTDSEIEFAIIPPTGRRFGDETEVTALNNLHITFGPVVRNDGRILLAIARPGDMTGNVNPVQTFATTNTNTSAEASSYVYHTVTFNLAGGSMNAPTSQSHRYNSTINNLPTPNRDGYMFGGWMINNVVTATPIQVRSNITLTAKWMAVESTADDDDDDGYSSYTPRQYAVTFNVAPGTFAGNETGIRIGNYGSAISSMPAAPTRTGYTFGGWQLPNGNTHVAGDIIIRGDMTLTALWTANPSASPSPTPTPTPTPTTAPRPNPQTNPIQVSFMIFGVVLTAGLAAFGIMTLTKKQMAAEGQYRSDAARFNREKRIMDLIDK